MRPVRVASPAWYFTAGTSPSGWILRPEPPRRPSDWLDQWKIVRRFCTSANLTRRRFERANTSSKTDRCPDARGVAGCCHGAGACQGAAPVGHKGSWQRTAYLKVACRTNQKAASYSFSCGLPVVLTVGGEQQKRQYALSRESPDVRKEPDKTPSGPFICSRLSIANQPIVTR